MANSSVSIIGTGNMAENLLRVFTEKGIEIAGVYGRNQDRLKELQNRYHFAPIHAISSISIDSIAFICVSDDAIQKISEKLPSNQKVVHTSGSVSLTDLNKQSTSGVFYPLQTLSKDRAISFEDVPILIESSSKGYSSYLEQLASLISKNVQFCNSEKRKKVHLAAVILNNFTTQLTKLAFDYLTENNLDSVILKPLLNETISKINDLGVDNSLTGPAKRGDQKTIDKHLELLDGDLKEVYELMSSIIRKQNGKL